jgi:hypothetical protein
LHAESKKLYNFHVASDVTDIQGLHGRNIPEPVDRITKIFRFSRSHLRIFQNLNADFRDSRIIPRASVSNLHAESKKLNNFHVASDVTDIQGLHGRNIPEPVDRITKISPRYRGELVHHCVRTPKHPLDFVFALAVREKRAFSNFTVQN